MLENTSQKDKKILGQSKTSAAYGTFETVSHLVTPSSLPVGGSGCPTSNRGAGGGVSILSEFPGLVEHPGVPERVAVISDLHIPFHSPRRVDAALSAIESNPPDLLLILGDVFDAYPISRWDKTRGRHKTLKAEAEIGKPIIDRIDRIGCETVLLLGNHDARIENLLDRQPELEGCFSFRSVFGVPDRWDVLPPRTLYRVGGMLYLHGDLPGSRGGVGCERRMLLELRESCMFGHTHSTGVHYMRGTRGELLAAYAIGHLTSPEVSREYRPINNWVSSFAEIRYNGVFPSVALRIVAEDGTVY